MSSQDRKLPSLSSFSSFQSFPTKKVLIKYPTHIGIQLPIKPTLFIEYPSLINKRLQLIKNEVQTQKIDITFYLPHLYKKY
jgi:hypothetical protein